MNQEQWQAYNNKVAEIRRVANIALDKAKEKFKQKITEERKAFIDEATKIATDIIEKERRNRPDPTPTTEGKPMKPEPKKPEVEMNEENKKILRQMGEIQALKRKEAGKPEEEEETEEEIEPEEEDEEEEAEEIKIGDEEQLEIDEELDAPQPDDPADDEEDQDERARKAMEPPRIYPPLGQKEKEKEMPDL